MKLSTTELSRHLWTAAELMRGSIDAADYKHYIFGLLFYRRLCDVWREEYEELLLKSDGDTTVAFDPAKHRYHIPFGHMWGDDPRPSPSEEEWPRDSKGQLLPRSLRAWARNIGPALNMAFHAIEAANPQIRGVFQDVDFSNSSRFPDHLMAELLQHFERHSLRKSAVDSRMLGDAYEYMIKEFADDAGKKGGEFYTPKAVVSLMVEVLDPSPGMSVYDPTCGSGGMLLEMNHHMERNGHGTDSLKLYGQERNLNTWSICKISLFLHEIESASIERGDTLRSPKFLSDLNRVREFDLVIANPPFSLKKWGYPTWASRGGDPYQRSIYGVPPRGYGDLAFVQHMIASLGEQGRMGVVIPNGVLFRGGSEQVIRRGIIQDDLLESIVSLGPNLFYGASIPATLLFLNRNKPAHKKGKVLIVNAEKEFVCGTAQNHLSAENCAKVLEVIRDHKEVPLFSRIVGLSEFEDNDFNLNIVRYVRTDPPPPQIDLQAVYADILELKNEAHTQFLNLDLMMKELNRDSG